MTTGVRVPTEEELEYLRTAPTGWIRDACNKIGIGGHVLNGPVPIRPFGFGNKHLAGPARTLQLLPHRGTGLKTYNLYAEVVPNSKLGEVLVIAGNALPGWLGGENMVHHSMQYGLAGWVTDLRMRDVAELREMDFPVLCTGATPETSGQEIVAVNVPVYIAGAQVRVGDIIVADDDGAVVIPIESFERALANIRDMETKEALQERLIATKAPMEELLACLRSKSVPV
ncbi:RraA family protein [Chloroflexota bacterium]